MKLTSNRLSSVLGTEVLEVDLAKPLADEQFDELRQAWLDADGVLVIRGQDLTPDQLIAFCRRFGELVTQFADPDYVLTDHPEVYRVSNKTQDGKALGRAKVYPFWHSTLSYLSRPAKVSFLFAIEVPLTGGDTMFANMYAAYDTLSPTMQGIISDLRAVHYVAHAAHGASTGKAGKPPAPAVEHPVVQTNPDTDRKALYVNSGFTSHIVGFKPSESTALLEFLNRHSTRPENIYRHRWQGGDLVLWDNRCTMHHTIADDEGTGARYMHRTTALCDEPR
jgi:taurine dioxygenase